MPRITLINNPMHDLGIFRKLTPPGLDVTVVERRGDNFSEVLRDTEYLVGYADTLRFATMGARIRVPLPSTL